MTTNPNPNDAAQANGSKGKHLIRLVMQRLRAPARRCAHRFLIRCTFNREQGRSPQVPYAGPTRTLSSFRSGGDHDDFWSCVKAEAGSAPAHDKPAGLTPPIVGDEMGGTAPGDIDSRPQRIPAGQAYRPDNSNDNYSSGSPRPEPWLRVPVFDMQSATHLSPIRGIHVREYKGTIVVDIRQFIVTPEGDSLPSKKGIALTVPQWRRLKEAMDSVDSEILNKQSRLNRGDSERDGPPGGMP